MANKKTEVEIEPVAPAPAGDFRMSMEQFKELIETLKPVEKMRWEQIKAQRAQARTEEKALAEAEQRRVAFTQAHCPNNHRRFDKTSRYWPFNLIDGSFELICCHCQHVLLPGDAEFLGRFQEANVPLADY